MDRRKSIHFYLSPPPSLWHKCKGQRLVLSLTVAGFAEALVSFMTDNPELPATTTCKAQGFLLQWLDMWVPKFLCYLFVVTCLFLLPYVWLLNVSTLFHILQMLSTRLCAFNISSFSNLDNPQLCFGASCSPSFAAVACFGFGAFA